MKPCLGILIILITGLLNTACKKSIDTPHVSFTKLKVLEYGTNFPVAGAQVRIYECNRRGFGGCVELSSPTRATTDKEGNFQFNSQLHPFYAEASESKYWSGSSGGTDIFGNELPVTDITLNPVGYTKIHIKKINQHPDGSLMLVRVEPDFASVYGSAVTFYLPVDTTLSMASYGNTSSTVSWYFLDGAGNVDTTQIGGQLPSYYINRFDTASVEINY